MHFLFDRAEKLPDNATKTDLLRSLIGGTLGIFVLLLLTEYTGNMMIMAPFGATCVLLFSASHSPLAKPRNVIFGHLIAGFVGLVILKYVGVNIFTIAFAVGLAIFFMHLLKCIHPPAGATTLVVLLTADQVTYGWDFLLMPVLAGSVALISVALVVNNIKPNEKWPAYWFALVQSRIEHQIEQHMEDYVDNHAIEDQIRAQNPIADAQNDYDFASQQMLSNRR